MFPLLDVSVATTVPDVTGLPVWAQALIALLATIITPAIRNYLKAKADKERAEIEVSEGDRLTNLKSQVKAYALDQAAVYVEREFPKLATLIATGKITDKTEIRAFLGNLGDSLRRDILTHVREVYNREALVELGSTAIDDIIRWAADKVSPFPGQETAEVLAKGGADLVLKYGVNKLEDKLSEIE